MVLFKFLLGLIIGALLTLYQGHRVYQLELERHLTEQETHSLCKDSKSHTAWVARKNGESRCFMEHNEYPHRAKGSNIDE